MCICSSHIAAKEEIIGETDQVLAGATRKNYGNTQKWFQQTTGGDQ